MRDYVQPTLSKLFPELASKLSGEVSKDRSVEVTSILPSKGYEHEDNPDWKKKLEIILQ